MNWITLNTVEQLNDIESKSFDKPQLILKHSTRCGISSSALHNMETGWDSGLDVDTYYLDLIAHRDVSNAISEKFKEMHQSPQVLVISKGKVIENVTHYAIDAKKIASKL